jgi:hypothetical protein
MEVLKVDGQACGEAGNMEVLKVDGFIVLIACDPLC